MRELSVDQEPRGSEAFSLCGLRWGLSSLASFSPSVQEELGILGFCVQG